MRAAGEVIGAAAGVVLYFGLLAVFPSSFGGYCIGPRYFTPALPLALLLVAGAARTMPRLFGVLLLASTLLMFVATLTEPLPDEQFKDPFRDVLFPCLRTTVRARCGISSLPSSTSVSWAPSSPIWPSGPGLQRGSGSACGGGRPDLD